MRKFQDGLWPFFISIIYTTAWCISGYGQIYQNWALKSVQGFSLDFLVLNFCGYTFYTIYSTLGYFTTLPGTGTVVLADLIFVYHSVVIVIVQAYQCLIYERGANKISKWAIAIIAILCCIIMGQIVLYNTGIIDYHQYWNPLAVMGYGKLVVTLIKYTPPAVWNCQRKSTKGWSIFNILMDLTGGVFSLASGQMSTQKGLNFTKVVLSIITIFYDLIFIWQHFVLFKDAQPSYEEVKQEAKQIKQNAQMDAYAIAS